MPERVSYLFDGDSETVLRTIAIMTGIAPFRWNVATNEFDEDLVDKLCFWKTMDDDEEPDLIVSRGDMFCVDIDFEKGMANAYSLDIATYTLNVASRDDDDEADAGAENEQDESMEDALDNLIDCCNDIIEMVRGIRSFDELLPDQEQEQ